MGANYLRKLNHLPFRRKWRMVTFLKHSATHKLE